MRSQVQQQIGQLQSRYQHEHVRLVKSIAQYTHLQEQLHTELSSHLTSLTHEVRHHNLFPYDYVKLTDRIAVFERDILELRQALPQKPLEGA